MSPSFIQLIRDFCAFAKMPDPGHVLRGGSIAVDGVLFSLTSTERPGRPALLVRCDFGELPEERLVDVCKTLLAANCYLYDGDGAAFSVCAKTSRVLFTKSYLLDALAASSLPAQLAGLAAQVHAWREQGFLEPLPEARKRRPGWASPQLAGVNFQDRS